MYRRADPTFTNWEPKTAYEAVDRFTRCQRNGLKAVMIPECLIKCSRRLPEPELDKFEEWIINPGGPGLQQGGARRQHPRAMRCNTG